MPRNMTPLNVFCAAVLVACGGPENDIDKLDRAAPLQGEANAELQQIGCGQPHASDSPYSLLKLPASRGYRFTFTATVRDWSAALTITDAESGETLFSSIGPGSVKATLTPRRDTTYQIFVFGYFHELVVECILETAPHCVTFASVDDDGNPDNNFYAANVDSEDAGQKLLADFGRFVGEEIDSGSCLELSRSMGCPESSAPVCADTPRDGTEYGNLCTFKQHVMAVAGSSGQSNGSWEPGPCQGCGGVAGIPCEEGKKCKLDAEDPGAGGTCHPVACTHEGVGYLDGETFPAPDGCNTCHCMASGLVACTEMHCNPGS